MAALRTAAGVWIRIQTGWSGSLLPRQKNMSKGISIGDLAPDDERAQVERSGYFVLTEDNFEAVAQKFETLVNERRDNGDLASPEMMAFAPDDAQRAAMETAMDRCGLCWRDSSVPDTDKQTPELSYREKYGAQIEKERKKLVEMAAAASGTPNAPTVQSHEPRMSYEAMMERELQKLAEVPGAAVVDASQQCAPDIPSSSGSEPAGFPSDSCITAHWLDPEISDWAETLYGGRLCNCVFTSGLFANSDIWKRKTSRYSSIMKLVESGYNIRTLTGLVHIPARDGALFESLLSEETHAVVPGIGPQTGAFFLEKLGVRTVGDLARIYKSLSGGRRERFIRFCIGLRCAGIEKELIFRIALFTHLASIARVETPE